MIEFKKILNKSIIILSLIFIATMSYYGYKYINYPFGYEGIIVALTLISIVPLRNLYSKYKYTYRSIWYYLITFIYLGYCTYTSIDVVIKRYLNPNNVFIRTNILFLLITLLIMLIISFIFKKEKELNQSSNKTNHILIILISGIYMIAFYSQYLVLKSNDISYLIILGTTIILTLLENHDIEYKVLFWIYVILIILSLKCGNLSIIVLLIPAIIKLDEIAKIGIKNKMIKKY